ncbi:hypothetical protein Tco_0779396 [Tanacetum coccineum]
MNLYAEFLHVDFVDDHYDVLDDWKYEDVAVSGCWDVAGCDWVDERVGYDDGSLSAISKDVFSKDVVLDAVWSSSATSLSFVLKKKGKSRVNFTRMREILKRSMMLSLRKGVRSHKVKGSVAKRVAGRSDYGILDSLIGLDEDEGDDDPQLPT